VLPTFFSAWARRERRACGARYMAWWDEILGACVRVGRGFRLVSCVGDEGAGGAGGIGRFGGTLGGGELGYEGREDGWYGRGGFGKRLGLGVEWAMIKGWY
jgi:hypothetical protein